MLIAAIGSKKLCSVGPHAVENLSQSDTKDTNILWKPIVDIFYLELKSFERYKQATTISVFLSSNNVIGKLISTKTIQREVVFVSKETMTTTTFKK